jgi:hypothetical protein
VMADATPPHTRTATSIIAAANTTEYFLLNNTSLCSSSSLETGYVLLAVRRHHHRYLGTPVRSLSSTEVLLKAITNAYMLNQVRKNTPCCKDHSCW